MKKEQAFNFAAKAEEMTDGQYIEHLSESILQGIPFAILSLENTHRVCSIQQIEQVLQRVYGGFNERDMEGWMRGIISNYPEIFGFKWLVAVGTVEVLSIIHFRILFRAIHMNSMINQLWDNRAQKKSYDALIKQSVEALYKGYTAQQLEVRVHDILRAYPDVNKALIEIECGDKINNLKSIGRDDFMGVLSNLCILVHRVSHINILRL